jgi:hypothetical protein
MRIKIGFAGRNAALNFPTGNSMKNTLVIKKGINNLCKIGAMQNLCGAGRFYNGFGKTEKFAEHKEIKINKYKPKETHKE